METKNIFMNVMEIYPNHRAAKTEFDRKLQFLPYYVPVLVEHESVKDLHPLNVYLSA